MADTNPYGAKCIICGYTKHLERCHIIPERFVRKTENYQKYSHIKSDNIVLMCRNHHWEYDHDLMESQDYKKFIEHIILNKTIFLSDYSYFICGKVESEDEKYTRLCNSWILKERSKIDKLGLLVDN